MIDKEKRNLSSTVMHKCICLVIGVTIHRNVERFQVCNSIANLSGLSSDSRFNGKITSGTFLYVINIIGQIREFVTFPT